jgi:hypothetical protein
MHGVAKRSTAQHGVAEMRAFRELASYVVYTEELGI